MRPERPILRYHGGKWLLAEWIIGHFPAHKVYVEPFGGAASVLLQKPRSYAEVYNELDSEIVNVFAVLRDPALAARLRMLLELTPFARDEFALSYEPSEDPLEQARRTVARAFMGFGSASTSGRSTGFRANSNRLGTTPARDWMNFPSQVDGFTKRLSGVVIENRDAGEVMLAHDGPQTLHYVDPPYMHETRNTDKGYRHEMTDAQHVELLAFLRELRGMVVLSGYDNPIYAEALADWRRVERASLADGARKRTEVLWLNAAASANRQSNLLTALAPERP